MRQVANHCPSAYDSRMEVSSRNEEGLAGQLIASGIDDLAKYRIVRLLYEHQSLAGDATLFATYLGFHSPEVTDTLLRELVAHGIIIEDDWPGRRPRYRLADNVEVHRRLVRLCNATGGSSEWAKALQILAGHSLGRARARACAAAPPGEERMSGRRGLPKQSNIAASGPADIGPTQPGDLSG